MKKGERREGPHGAPQDEKLAAQEALAELGRLVDAFDHFEIRRFRKALGLSQERLARLADVPLRTVTRWEAGGMEPLMRSLKHCYERLIEAGAGEVTKKEKA